MILNALAAMGIEQAKVMAIVYSLPQKIPQISIENFRCLEERSAFEVDAMRNSSAMPITPHAFHFTSMCKYRDEMSEENKLAIYSVRRPLQGVFIEHSNSVKQPLLELRVSNTLS